jgi:hypothetical protein
LDNGKAIRCVNKCLAASGRDVFWDAADGNVTTVPAGVYLTSGSQDPRSLKLQIQRKL